MLIALEATPACHYSYVQDVSFQIGDFLVNKIVKKIYRIQEKYVSTTLNRKCNVTRQNACKLQVKLAL